MIRSTTSFRSGRSEPCRCSWWSTPTGAGQNAAGVRRLRQGQSREGQLCRGRAPAPRRTWRGSEFAQRSGAKLVVVPHPRHRARPQPLSSVATCRPHSCRWDRTSSSCARACCACSAAATPKRQAHLPEVPTFGEQGFPGFVAETWFALFAPKGTPQAILDQINGYTRSIHDDPEMSRKIATSYVSPFPLTQPEFAALVKAGRGEIGAGRARIRRQAGLRKRDDVSLTYFRPSDCRSHCTDLDLFHQILVDMRQDGLGECPGDPAGIRRAQPAARAFGRML